ncbi:hypothetical protein GCM10010353_67480 [Streptomyces chryseus]|nr:hypothetical protein GCM10010353_67480 [Streptomyces chryseus]
MRRLLHLLQHIGGDLGEEQLQDTDGVAAVGDRGQDPLPLAALSSRCPHQPLAAQDLVVDAAP